MDRLIRTGGDRRMGQPIGVVNVLSPATRTIDAPDATPCETARSRHTLLVTTAESKHTASEENAPPEPRASLRERLSSTTASAW